MRKGSILASIIALTFAVATAFAQDQRNYTKADFVNIDGSSLNDKIDRAVKQFKNTKQGDTVWLAYHFPPREDSHVGMFSGTVYRDSDGVKLERKEDTTQIAVILLTDASGSQPKFIRIKTLNQSVAKLEGVMRADAQNRELSRGALRAIAAHDSPRSLSLLKEIAAKNEDVE